MKSYTENLHNELLLKLDELNKNYDPNTLYDPRLSIVILAIEQIKAKLLHYRFRSNEEEIHYFKTVLPKTMALYIYYFEKIEWDRITHRDSSEQKFKFLDRIFSMAEQYRREYCALYEYYRDGKSDLDDLYFLRSSPLNKDTQYPLGKIIDSSSPPYHCFLLAILLAYTRLESELKLSNPENKESKLSGNSVKPKLRWTGKQSELIELGYGLYEMGSFNNGKASLNEIFTYLGEVFEVDTGNTSRLFQDIVRRKAGYTTFLNQMIARLLKKIDNMLN
jgi:hypothetical protein